MTIADGTQPGGETSGDDISGLILAHLETRAERNVAEAQAISLAYDKYIFEARRKKQGTRWLTDEFIRNVHQDMLGSIWDWAGKYRRDNLNIGMDWHLIPEQVRLLCDDFLHWDAQASTMPVLEVAARLQNRLTKIHPFRNGNGRHARLMTDIFFLSRRHPLLEWPQTQLMSEGHQIRAQYITAMQDADQGDFSSLVKFFEACLPKPS
ncbi:MAG TPA: mobile mystery protein B [Nitrospira sp.]|nr:mobile mystery protein B [Nitrospira sp.]